MFNELPPTPRDPQSILEDKDPAKMDDTDRLPGMVKIFQEQTTLGEFGYVTVCWTKETTAQEIKDLRSWFNLIVNKMKRSCGVKGDEE